ncbi:anthranilate N-methyltransferase-like [Cryptomeria japonica]|uniref:anthranilate N-methyltransferase-like n=1 Tax=Cryptomeria japonica TaxID=3369 RepID=UPI0027DA1389|nr:anthranilate N-methyltransferase-like [Cryptomeria japonica]
MEIWAYGKAHLKVNSIINGYMASFTMMAMKEIVSCYRGFEELGPVVDIDGGHGVALGLIVKAYLHVQGINFDLPHVIQTALDIPGIEHMEGNMFESIPHGDGIILKSVLHDWDDDSCVKILDYCYKALGEKGKLVLLEAMLPNLQVPTEGLEMLGDFVMMAHGNG